MPTYQYACTAAGCANEFELVQSFTDPAASECPACGAPVRKVFSAVGVVFKGSGFYRTDSRAAPSNGKASEGSKATSDSSSSGDSSNSAGKSSSAGGSSGTSSNSSGGGSSNSTSTVAASA